MIRLPYKGESQSMIMILPNSDVSIESVSNNFDPKVFDYLFYRNPQNVDVVIPKFKMTIPTKLKKELKAMGMKTPFSDMATFPKMTPTNDLKNRRSNSQSIY